MSLIHGITGKGVSGKQLSSKFGRRDDPEYILELGNTLASMCRNIPGGVLIFFPVSVILRFIVLVFAVVISPGALIALTSRFIITSIILSML